MTELDACLMCGESVLDEGVSIHTLSGPRTNHRECALREVLGGIGHHLGHEYWCLQRHDPDAGLTYHQSALLVMRLYELLGDELITRDASAPDAAEAALPVSDDDEWAEAVVRWAEGDPPEWPPPWPA